MKLAVISRKPRKTGRLAKPKTSDQNKLINTFVNVTAALPQLTRKALHRPVRFSGSKSVRIFCFCSSL